jgi:hypothetical protein
MVANNGEHLCSMSAGKRKAVVSVLILAETTEEVSRVALQLNLKDVAKTHAL